MALGSQHVHAIDEYVHGIEPLYNSVIPGTLASVKTMSMYNCITSLSAIYQLKPSFSH
jgi:hypothetical protein